MLARDLVFSHKRFSRMMYCRINKAQHIDSVGGVQPLQVVYRQVSELTPDKRNARTHPKRQIEQLKAAISAFGFTNPILVDETAMLIAGHGRLRAAK